LSPGRGSPRRAETAANRHPALAEGTGGATRQRTPDPGRVGRVPRPVNLAGIQESLGHLAGRRFSDLPGLCPLVSGPESTAAGSRPAPSAGTGSPADQAVSGGASETERDTATAGTRHLALARGPGPPSDLGAGNRGAGRPESSAADPGEPELPDQCGVGL